MSLTLKSQIKKENLSKTFHLQISEHPVRIGRNVAFYEDKSGKMTFAEIQRQQFIYLKTDIPNFNVTENAIWGKIKFTCSEKADWYFQLDPASFNEVFFYHRKNKEGWITEKMGNTGDLKNRPIPINHFMFKINIEPGDTSEIYFKVQDYYLMQFDINAGTLESFIGPIHNSNMYDGICYGIMIMMLIYNFYLYLTQKVIVYLHYMLYVFFSIIFSAYLVGYGLHFPAAFIKVLQFAPIIPPAFFGIFGLLFTLQLFKEVLGAGFRKIVYCFIFIVAANMVLSTTVFVHFSEMIIQPLGLVLGIICISGGFIALKKNHSSAWFYLIGFGAYMLCLFYLIFAAQGYFILNNFTWHALTTGSAIESILLSFAIGDKLKVSLREKQKAQEASLIQANENARLIKEQNIILESKVKERTQELQEKNKEILDSIYYARRIQHTLLAHRSLLKNNLPEHFILFQPKDIVSGDFYWATCVPDASAGSKNNGSSLFFLASCDSTGHGVPGAFMSLLNISFLNEAITEKRISDPAKVFDHVRLRLIENISHDGGKDGMDGILCCFETPDGNEQSCKLHYAASNNTGVVVRDKKITQLQKDKMPVGHGEKTDPFTSHDFLLQKNDCLYLFTDGYADQFGGPKGKKFKSRQLEERLLEINDLPLIEQKGFLEQTFNNWKGNLEQIDDVLIIGIKF
ncbi:MAG: protein serine/threonine phosphatase [Bacteroidetes bacterium]|nr:protein serine/threonine phosphatase [Bacteroidota bacterium]